jgi:hypothetical protein
MFAFLSWHLFDTLRNSLLTPLPPTVFAIHVNSGGDDKKLLCNFSPSCNVSKTGETCRTRPDEKWAYRILVALVFLCRLLSSRNSSPTASIGGSSSRRNIAAVAAAAPQLVSQADWRDLTKLLLWIIRMSFHDNNTVVGKNSRLRKNSPESDSGLISITSFNKFTLHYCLKLRFSEFQDARKNYVKTETKNMRLY